MPKLTLDGRELSPGYTVNDLERSIKFYTDGLGFAIDAKFEHEGKVAGVMLKAGEARLGLSQDDFSKGRERVKGVGMRSYIETTQDIHELARQAKAAGIELEQGPGELPWGAVGFTVTDPDGFKLTISNPTPK